VIDTSDDRGNLLFFKGYCNRELKQFDEAEDLLYQVLEMEKEISKGELAVPWSYVILAEVQLERAQIYSKKIKKKKLQKLQKK